MQSSIEHRTNRYAEPDTRRFASIFPEDISVDCGDATDEVECNDDPDDSSHWEFVAVLDNNTSTTQGSSVASIDERSTISAAQQIIASYRAVHGNDHEPEHGSKDINEKELPRIPDDQRSMYTLATSGDAQSTLDLMWRPKPKVLMRRTDQGALVEAQAQAMAMMLDAGLKPTNRIQCRRRGCADILPDVEALKYHIHIHNIADANAMFTDASLSAVRKPSLVGSSSFNPTTSKSSQKSSLGTQRKYSTTSSPARKLSGGGLLPPLLSPRDSAPETQCAHSLTAAAKVFISDPNPCKSSGPLPVHSNKETSSTLTSTSSRDRRTRKEFVLASGGAGCTASMAMVLSPPSSPTISGRAVLAPHTNLPLTFPFNSVVLGEKNKHVFMPNENTPAVSEIFTRSRGSTRALSPVRAMSPIRKGLRRVLSIGCSVDFTDE